MRTPVGAHASRLRIYIVAMIVAAAVVAFMPALRAPFVFDDIGSIVENPTIRVVFPLSRSLSPPPHLAVSGRPLVNLSLALNRATGAGTADTSAFHATNLLLHILCGLLLLGVVRRTMRHSRYESADTVALAVAAIWLVHPIQTEAVDYVIQRTELLVSLFYLATLYASIRAWDSRRRFAWLALSVAVCFGGMASKEVMVSAPLAIVAYDFIFRESSWRALLHERGVYYALLFASLGLLGALIASGGRADSVGFGLGLPWYTYLYSQAWAISHYLLLLVWPHDLRFDYGSQPVVGAAGVPGIFLVIGIVVGAVYSWRRGWRWLSFLALWFLLLIAPSSSVIPIRTEIAAERRVYLASAAFVTAVVVGAAYVWREHRRRFVAATTIIACLCVVVANRRSALYSNPEGLWRDALEKSPGNPRAYDNLASIVMAKGDRVEAESLWTKAVSLDSAHMTAWSNLAQLRVEQGRLDDARALLERAVRINPEYVDATRRLAGVLVRQGETSRSIPMLERIAASAAATDESMVMLAQAYMMAGRTADGVGALRRALELNPRRADASALLGAMLAQTGRMDLAIPYLENAAANGDRNGMTYAVLSLAYAESGRANDAVNTARMAGEYARGDGRVFLAAGRAMQTLGRIPEAEAFFQQAMDAAPNDPEAITRLGLTRAARGDLAGASQLFRRALQIAPGYPPALQAMKKLAGAP